MTDANIDVERLIVEVGQAPCLYGLSHEEYKDRNVKQNTWQRICGLVYSAYDASLIVVSIFTIKFSTFNNNSSNEL